MQKTILHTTFTRRAESAQYVLDQFQIRFNKNPADAFTWGDDTFKAAAQLKIANDILNHLEQDFVSAEELHKALMQKVMDKAQFYSNSSSMSANTMQQCMLSTYADYARVVFEVMQFEADK